MLKQRDIALVWPARGLDEKTAYRAQPPYSTPSALNVWPADAIEERYRGGSRPGLANHYAPSSKTLVQAIDEVTVVGSGGNAESRFIAIIDGDVHFEKPLATISELGGDAMSATADLQMAFHNQNAYIAGNATVKTVGLTDTTPEVDDHEVGAYALKIYSESGTSYPTYRYDATGQGVWDKDGEWYPGWPHTEAGVPAVGPFYNRYKSALSYISGTIYLGRWGGAGTAPTQFGGGNAKLRVDRDSGRLYCCDPQNSRVQVFSQTGAYLFSFGVSGTGNGEFGSGGPLAIGIRVVGADNIVVYVSDQGNSRIQYFDGYGVYQGQWGSAGTGNGQFGATLPGIAFDSSGNVYVVDQANSRVQKFTSTGTYSAQFGSVGTGNGQYTNPRAVAIDSSNNIYVLDQTRIQKLNSSFTFQSSVTVGTAQFRPDMVLDPGGSTLWVADAQETTPRLDLRWYSTALVLQGSLSSTITGETEGSFARPTGLAWTADGTTLFVRSTSYVVRLGDPRGAPRYIVRVEEADGVRETYDYDAADPLNQWTSTSPNTGLIGRYKGILPTSCPLICRWADRIVLAGNPSHLWYMSRMNDPADWDYGRPSGDIGRAVAAQSSFAGTIGEPITALIPINDQFIIFAGRTSLWVLRGNPAYNGEMVNLSRNIGCVGPNAWCLGPQGEVYILSLNGLFLVRSFATEDLQALSSELPLRLKGKDNSAYRINMAYDRRNNGFHVYITPRSSGTAEHYFVDIANKGFWPMSFAAANTPTACARVGQDLMVGCGSGAVRKYSQTAVDDNSTDFASHVVIGPWKCGDGFTNEGLVKDLDGVLATGSGAVTWSLYTGDHAETVADAAAAGGTAFATGSWLAGHNYRDRPNGRAMYAAIRLSSDGSGDAPRWAFESAVARIRDAGRLRLA